ncbi:MAG TPA: 4Fe-4S binding protein [Candidatus Lokiarchaeia archaeon]|nr:4Fe-4S binding protein [Candidatus Lokiarchaeia archaeon]
MTKIREYFIQTVEFSKLLQALLSSGKVNAIVAVQQKKDRISLAPLIITDADSIPDLPVLNYIVYGYDSPDTPAGIIHRQLNGARDQRIAYIGRPDDHYALIELAKRKQVVLENIISITIEGIGTVNAKKLARRLKELKIDPATITKEILTKDALLLMDESGGETSVLFDEKLQIDDNFGLHDDIASDIFISTVGLPGSESELYIAAGTALGEEILNLSSGSLKPIQDEYVTRKDTLLSEAYQELSGKLNQKQENWDAYSSGEKYAQLAKCTMCGMCITVCPVCFCKDCNLKAQRKEKTITSGATYQLTRLAHDGDACIGCGRCNTVCPVNVPLSNFLIAIRNGIKSKFNYEAGASLDTAPLRSHASICGEKSSI